MKTLFEHEKATIQYNEQTNAVEMIWKKNQDPESYMLLFTKVVEFIQSQKATGFFSDIRKEGVVGPNSSKWVQTEILPKAFDSGLKKIAVVMDADIFKEFYVENIGKVAGNGRLKYFDSAESANRWLLEN